MAEPTRAPSKNKRTAQGAALSTERIGLFADWLPVSDALQTGTGLLYEFKFGILNGRAGLKRILLEEECVRLRQARVRPSRASLIQAARERALEIKLKLESNPGLTRSAIAKELGVDRARITQILRRFKE